MVYSSLAQRRFPNKVWADRVDYMIVTLNLALPFRVSSFEQVERLLRSAPAIHVFVLLTQL